MRAAGRKAQRHGTGAAHLVEPARIVSRPSFFQNQKPVDAAWQQVQDWRNCAAVWIPQPTARHHEIVGPLFVEQTVDAHLAALSIDHGLLCAPNGYFARFCGLWCENPLLWGAGWVTGCPGNCKKSKNPTTVQLSRECSGGGAVSEYFPRNRLLCQPVTYNSSPGYQIFLDLITISV